MNKPSAVIKSVGISILVLPFLSALKPIKTLKTEPNSNDIAITIAKGVKKESPRLEISHVLST